jgi:transposase
MSATQGFISREEMEYRRLLAARELANGASQSKVARKFGVSRTTTSRWNRALSDKGVEALRKRRATGRPSRLTSEQKSEIVTIHSGGAMACGFPDDRWTTARLAEAIEKRFGIRYDQDHVGRLMHGLGLRKPKVHYIFPLSAFGSAKRFPGNEIRAIVGADQQSVVAELRAEGLEV